MELLSRRVDAAIDQLTKLAFGDQALVTNALAMYARGDITDLVGYIRNHRDETRRPGHGDTKHLPN